MKQLLLSGVLAFFSISSFAQSESIVLEEIPNPDPHRYANFGSDLLVNQNQAIVLAKGYSEGLRSNGAFYVYTNEGNGAWQLSQKVVHTSTTPVTEWFGSSAAADRDFLLIGAHNARQSKEEAYPAGAAFMYHRNANGKWELSQRLSILPGEDAKGQQFGMQVALKGNHAAVLAGASEEVYLFEKQGTSWSFTQKISGADYLRKDGFKPDFGVSLAIEGDYLYVGASTDDSDTYGSQIKPRSGAVYVFKNSGKNWTLDQKITQPAREAQAYFGTNINVSGNLMLVSSQEDRQGVVEIFQRNNEGIWNFIQKLTPTQRKAIDRFGANMAIDGNLIAVSAPNYEVSGVMNAGAVFIYKKDNTTGHWLAEDVITSPNPVSSERMGSVHLKDGIVMVGMPSGSTSTEKYTGTVYSSSLPFSSQEIGDDSGQSLRLYPNPATTTFTLQYIAGTEKIESIQVFDYSGRPFDVNFDEEMNTADISGLSAGVYLLRVQLENGEVLAREFTVDSH